jgi:hypothetical protein
MKFLKIALAGLLFLCLMDMPYGYYQFVRFSCMIGFGVLAFKANQTGRETEMFIFGALALLFQPLFKIALGRELWNLIDIIVGLGLLYSALYKRSKP